MLDRLIDESLRAAYACDADARAPALMHIARVLTVRDRAEAARVFDEAIDLLAEVHPNHMRCFGDRALLLGAAVRPDRVRDLATLYPSRPLRFRMNMAVQTMLEHGHIAEAIAYMTDGQDGEYPYLLIPMVLRQHATTVEERGAILRAAVAAWRREPVRLIFRVFASEWRVLPRTEAGEVLRELLAYILRQPDQGTHARVGDSVEITSEQDFNLFELLPVLRDLEPELTESLVQSRPQLAKAAARLSRGMESMMSETPPSPPAGAKGRGFSMCGNPKDFPMMERLMEAEQEGNLEPFFDEATRLYRADSDPGDPNLAPRECWPSTQQFRRTFHLAGRIEGGRATSHLDRVPDSDLRLFSQIALAASLSNLPALRLSQSEYHPHRRR